RRDIENIEFVEEQHRYLPFAKRLIQRWKECASKEGSLIVKLCRVWRGQASLFGDRRCDLKQHLAKRSPGSVHQIKVDRQKRRRREAVLELKQNRRLANSPLAI